MTNKHKFPFRWSLKDAKFTKDKGKVFSCFACGGGSTLGYKLAGYDVLGCNEIDPRMMEIYTTNHKPKYSFLEPIQEFKDRENLPKELFNLDILDGSPPCSSFSISGKREKDWGKEKKFKEGQAKQILDTLFFDFIDLAKKLQPKVVVAENVEGLLKGKARAYVRRIYKEMDEAGYYCQHWLFDAGKMGVPQRRKRVFFVALRKDLGTGLMYQQDMFVQAPKLNLHFNEPMIPFSEIYEKDAPIKKYNKLYESEKIRWDLRVYGDADLSDCDMRLRGKGSFFNQRFAYPHKICPTLISTQFGGAVLFDEPRKLCESEYILGGSFPSDFDFCGFEPGYVVGMSVPPIMTAQIASEIHNQWLSKI